MTNRIKKSLAAVGAAAALAGVVGVNAASASPEAPATAGVCHAVSNPDGPQNIWYWCP